MITVKEKMAEGKRCQSLHCAIILKSENKRVEKKG